MTSTTLHNTDRSLVSLVRRSIEVNPWLAFTGIISLLVLAVTLVLAVVDPRTITGAPAWHKPMKFAISIAIYSFTFLWLLNFLREERPKLVTLASVLTAAGLLVELAIIALQAGRGTLSHYNMSTPFNAVMYYLMAGWIGVVWAMNLLAAGLMLFRRFEDQAFAWGLRMALVVTLVGAGLGFVMTANVTDEQMANIEQTGDASFAGAHSIGVEDGGPGLPFLGWSTVAGDIRVPHFVGLHALQVMPFVGWVVAQRVNLPRRSRAPIVISVGAGYLLVVLILLWQALRGQPVIAPDALTLGAFALTALGTAAAIGISIFTAQSK